jgi:hypothetical protein
VIAEKLGLLNFDKNANFQQLTKDRHTSLNDFKSGHFTIEKIVQLLADDLDRFIQNYQATKLVDQASLFPDRLQSIKHMLFGPDNQRAILTSGLKPSLSEIGDIFDQSSDTYKEIVNAYQPLKNKIPPIQAKIDASLARQLADYNNSETPPLNLKLDDLSNEQFSLFKNIALRELPSEELQLYREYGTFLDVEWVLHHLPKPMCYIMAALGRRAQTRVARAENDLKQFQEEIALWFDRSMNRASGVYDFWDKGLAIWIGFAIAFCTNADTFNLFNRLSIDGSLRDVIVKRASEIAPNSSVQPVTKEEMEKLKRDTNVVLRDVALPISWTPANLVKQFECSYARPLSENATDEQEWNNLFTACQQKEQPNRKLRVEEKILKLMETALIYHPWSTFKMFLGWFLTGFALSMGAPFWFDLLRKVVNIHKSYSNQMAKDEPTTSDTTPKS